MLAVDNVNKLIAFHRWQSTVPNQDVVVIANFANTNRNHYALNFPSGGNWYVHLNSDSTSYGPDYGNAGSSVVIATGNPARANVTIGPYSALILSQTPDAPPRLTITATNTLVNISWPAAYSEWVLNESTSATRVSDWVPVSPMLYRTNSSTVSIIVTPLKTTSFYRLEKP